jgi:hypothetical protein
MTMSHNSFVLILKKTKQLKNKYSHKPSDAAAINNQTYTRPVETGQERSV